MYNNFIGNYASTIDGIQGAKIEKPFSIWEMDHRMFNLNRLNSAMGRATRKDYIHFSNPSPEIKYEWQVYPDNVTVKSKPKNTDKRYNKTNFYMVIFTVEDKMYMYRGHTVNSGQWRLNEHFTSATQNPTSKFHKKLALADFDKVKIFITETRSFSCRTAAEAHEMLLLEEDIKKYDKAMVNVRHRKKEVKEIVPSKTKQITEAEYEKISKPKIEIYITNLEKRETLRVHYTVNGKRIDKYVRYTRSGYDKGLEKAEEIKREIEMTL